MTFIFGHKRKKNLSTPCPKMFITEKLHFNLTIVLTVQYRNILTQMRRALLKITVLDRLSNLWFAGFTDGQVKGKLRCHCFRA